VDELTDPHTALAGEPVRVPDRVGRAAATITGWNLLSRLTGFARTLATAGALGVGILGDTYQSANVVSNILFELLAGGLLFSVLVPTFVGLLDQDRRDQASALAGVLLARALAALGALVVVGIVAAPLIMRALTLGVEDPAARQDQVRLGSFLLWFILPQLLLYATGAVSSALLQADRRFTAVAVAPVFNNVVVLATMVAFAAVHRPAAGLTLTGGEKLLLGGGTLAGTVALTAVLLVGGRRRGLVARPRWRDPGATGLAGLARKGLWGAGHIGLNQVLVAATVIWAARVRGGVIAYQTAFTFFLLPHAVLAHPIFTALFPRLSTAATAGDMDRFADDVGGGVRAMALLLAPAAGLLAVVALPALTVARVGRLDGRGAELVAAVLSAYLVGLLGYSAFFLLTRASYALGDVRSPTAVNLGVTLGAVAAMAATSTMVDGDGRVVVLGLVHAVAVTGGSVVLFGRLQRAVGRPVPVAATLARAVLGTAVAVGVAVVPVRLIGTDGRGSALLAVVAAAAAGLVAYAAVLALTRTPELELLRARRQRRQSPAARS